MARFNVYLQIRSGVDAKLVRECTYEIEARSKKEAKSKAALMAQEEVEFDPRIDPYLCFFIAEKEEQNEPGGLAGKRVVMVEEGELERFLEARKSGGRKRLEKYWVSRFVDLANDSYNRVYVNQKKGTPIDEDLPALKAALGLGDGKQEYFLVHHSW